MRYTWFKDRESEYVYRDAISSSKTPPAVRLLRDAAGFWIITIPVIPPIRVTYRSAIPPFKLALMALYGVGHGLAHQASRSINRRVASREERIAVRPEVRVQKVLR